MNILGIHIGHDSSASLTINGKIVADVAEERFTRIKHYSGIPVKSIDYCLKHSGIDINELSAIAICGGRYEIYNNLFSLKGKNKLKPGKKKQLFEVFSSVINPVIKEFPVYINRYSLKSNIPIIKVKHHKAHASSAFYTSGFRGDTLILTLDGIGGGISGSVWHGKEDGRIECLHEFERDCSLGWFYGNVTEALGWWHGDGEGKTMGLAPYGKYDKAKKELENFCPKFSDGFISKKFSFAKASVFNLGGATHWHFSDAYKIKSLLSKYPPEDIAAAAQKILEGQVKNILFPWIKKTGFTQVCCAGGVFLNVKLNQRILQSGICKKLHIFPNAGDSGLAAGASLNVYNQLNTSYNPYKIEQLYLGPAWTNNEIKKTLDLCNIKYISCDNVSSAAAGRLADGKIIGWYQGRMESGPRALGNRSILVSANNAENKDILNARVKFREGFRPFCPSLLDEKKHEYLENTVEAPFMIISFDVKNKKRDKIPAVVHKDDTLRPQTVKKEINEKYWSLINNFGDITGEYLILNTSFNIRGEPIVLEPIQAIRCFFGGGMDSLIIGDFIIDKNK